MTSKILPKTLLCTLFVSSHAWAEQEVESLFDLTLEQLLDVEISTAGKVPEKIRDIPASVVILSRADLTNAGYTTVDEALRNIPGLYNIYNYEGAPGNYGVRGFFNSRSQNSSMAILVNGISQVQTRDRSNPMEKITLPIEAVDRIEVIRGPMAVIYGNGASFGVINIVTNQAGQMRHSGMLSAGGGSQGERSLAMRYSYHGTDWDVVLNAGRYQNDGVDPRYEALMSPQNQAALPGLGVDSPQNSLGGQLEQQKHYVGVSAVNDRWHLEATFNETDLEPFVLIPPVANGNQRHTKSSTFHIGYHHPLGAHYALDAKATLNDYRRDTDFDALFPGFYGVERVEYDSYNTEWTLTYKPSDTLNAIVGFNFQKMTDSDSAIDAPTVGLFNELVRFDKRITRSVFTQVTYDQSERLRFVAGLRYEKVGRYDRRGFLNLGEPEQALFGGEIGGEDNLTPRIAAIYSLDDHQLLKFLYGQASYISDDRYESEDITTYELNYLYAKQNVMASVSVFANALDNLLVEELRFTDAGVPNIRQSSSGKIDTLGIEMLLNQPLATHWDVELGATYQDSDDSQNPSIAVAYSPKLVFHGKLKFHKGIYAASLSGRYVDDMASLYDASIANPDGTFGNRIGERVASYFVVDANLHLEPDFADIYIDFKIRNLFDSEVRYPNNLVNSELLDRGTIDHGRRYSIGFGWRF